MSDRIKWTDQMVADGILEVMNFIGIDRMPTYKEMNDYYSNSKLANRITKTGGSHYWADKLNIPMKHSESQLGFEIELEVESMLKEKGFKCELTSIRHPYDILVNGRVKIDVKSANESEVHGSSVYSFGLAKAQPTCDVYIAACLDMKKSIKKIFVIPAHVMTGKTQLCLGVNHSKYDLYINRWDIISSFDEAFKNVI